MRRLLLSNAAVRLLTTPIAALAGLVSSWLAVGHLGTGTYAAVLLITGLAQLLPFADFGVGAAVISTLSSKDAEDVRFRTLVSAQRVLVAAGSTMVVGAGLLSTPGLWPALLGEGSAPVGDANLSSFAFFIAFAVFVFVQLGYRMLTGLGLNHLTSLLAGAGSVLSVGLIGLGVLLGMDPIWFVLAPTSASITTAALAGLIAGKRSGIPYGQLLRAIPSVQSVPQLSLARTAVPMLVILVALPALLFSHRLILSHVSSSAALAEYTLASQVYAPAWAAVSGTLMALWPHFAAARDSDVRRSLRSLRTGVVAIAALGVLGAAALTAVTPLATRIIGHGESVASWWVAGGFGALLLAQTAFYPLGMYLTRPRELVFQAICVALMLAVGLPTSIFAAAAVGPAGPLWVSAGAILLFQAVPAIGYVSMLTSRARNEG